MSVVTLVGSCAATARHFGLIITIIIVVTSLTIVAGFSNKGLEFTIEPSDVVVHEGNSVLLQCAGIIAEIRDGKTFPNIRWRGPDGQDLGIIGDTFRTQLANGSLYISSVEENHGLTGPYQCLLSADGIGTIVSRFAFVSIAKLPELNQISREVYLHPDETAYLRCLSEPMQHGVEYKIQWLRDDVPVHIDHLRMVLMPSGALEIDELTASDRGTYQCNVTSGTFSRLSAKTNLNIKPPMDLVVESIAPTFLTEASSTVAREGETVTLDCVANGFPRPLIKWLRNGEEIDLNDLDSRFRIIGTGSLQISSIDDTDTGAYQCRASNRAESLDIQAHLQVQVPPKFMQSPEDKEAYEKDEIELGCSIHSKPTPVIKWLKNGDIITPNDYMQIVNGHNLRILGLIRDDAGMFQCVGSNPAGSVQASARLIVLELGLQSRALPLHKKYNLIHRPQWSEWRHQLDQPTATFDQTNNITKISKNILDSLQSKDKDKTPNDYDDEDYDSESDDEDEGTIHPYDPNIDPETYFKTLMTNNNENQSEKNEILEFSQPPFPTVTRTPHIDGAKAAKTPLPGPPRDLVAQIVKPRFVALSWMEPIKNPDEVVSYTIFYKMSTSERERKITTSSRDDQQVNIQSLLPGKTYQFRVIGNSNRGPGESSKIFEVSTQPEENIAGPPQNVTGYALSHNEISLKWEAPQITNGNITNYRIYYVEGDNGFETSIDTVHHTAVIGELRPYTEYTISVVPFNQNGMGDTSPEIIVKTYSASPSEPPSNVSLEATSSTSIIVRWEPPPLEEQNGQITGYKIRYRKQKKQPQVETTPANVRHFELKNLDKMSGYQVKIAAMTINGTGPFTEAHPVETYENDLNESMVPDKPVWIKTRPNAESIGVAWGPPASANIKVRGYVLGWGKGVPDEETRALDENLRNYEIMDLEPNSEYVISLRARNNMGDGPPIYDYIRTRNEPAVDLPSPLEVPVGLRAITLSASSIVVYWTDTTLSKSQHVTDNRNYVVRFNSVSSPRYRYHNTTDLNCMISDLKPNSQYEFAVKVTKGRRESAWSMSVFNTTSQASFFSSPRNVTVQNDEQDATTVIVQWLPPRHSNSPVTGYIVFYTTDTLKRDRDWMVQAVVGDTTMTSVHNLKPLTMYYFKVQARNKFSNGPFSAMVSHKTGLSVGVQGKQNGGLFGNVIVVYSVVATAIVTIIIAIIVVLLLCRRKPISTPESSKKSYQKNNVGINQPPDLWIHHDQMELKNIEKNHVCGGDGASSSGAMTLPRPVPHEYDTEAVPHVTNSLDKRSYVPGYINSSERPAYPRTQFNIASRPHVSMDQTLSQQNLAQSQTSSIAHTPETPYGYDSMPSNYSNPSVTYAPGVAVDAPKRGQGHPLKSFSVPGPPLPAVATPTLPNQSKHTVPAVTIRPQNASPFKKGGSQTGSIPNRLQGGPSVAHSTDEIQRLAPSSSTEELNQEMANLEGLMKDLSAITANEFEC